MKKVAMFVLAVVISIVFATTGFTQDKPAAAPAPDKAVAAPEKAKDEAPAKKEKKAKKSKKAKKAKKEAKPAEEKAAEPAPAK